MTGINSAHQLSAFERNKKGPSIPTSKAAVGEHLVDHYNCKTFFPEKIIYCIYRNLFSPYFTGGLPSLITPGFEFHEILFNAHRCTAGVIDLRRDPLDVLLAYQNGVDSVACFLTGDSSPHQLRIFADFPDANNSLF